MQEEMRNSFLIEFSGVFFSTATFWFFLIHYLVSSNTVYFLASCHKLSRSDSRICFNVTNMVVNQKEADVYPQNVPCPIPTPLSPRLFLN